ncbi:3-oxoacid CoA-transferase [Suillus weaverae]|nr:3-oxoacid CoA-transferase [Suillus weaverae]
MGPALLPTHSAHIFRRCKGLASFRLSIRRYATQPESAALQRKKVWASADAAVQDVKSGDIVLSGGFGLCGTPETLITALSRRNGVHGLTAVSNNAGSSDLGLVKLMKSGQLDKLIISYLGGNKYLERMYLDGKMSLELVPQGTLVERMRAHGAGIPAFFTPTGASTTVETGGIPIRFKAGGFKEGILIPGNKKEYRDFNGKRYIMEPAIAGDVAFIHAWKADEAGNLMFRHVANNYNNAMARNAQLVIAEAEEIVPIGSLPPNAVHVPGIFVDRVVQATEPKGFDIIATAPPPGTTGGPSPEELLEKSTRRRIAKRAAQELRDGFYVNLGVGIPTLVTEYLRPSVKIWLQSENGILGMGPFPTEDQVDPDITNAGKETVTLLPGASIFDSTDSFGMIRGGHMDVAILGAMQVSQAGDIANFMIPGKLHHICTWTHVTPPGIGGAMDLVSNPDKTKVIVAMEHCAKDGGPKIMQECSLPLTGTRAVSQIITELAVFNVDRSSGFLTLMEVAKGVAVEEVQAKTACDFKVSDNLGQM